MANGSEMPVEVAPEALTAEAQAPEAPVTPVVAPAASEPVVATAKVAAPVKAKSASKPAVKAAAPVAPAKPVITPAPASPVRKPEAVAPKPKKAVPAPKPAVKAAPAKPAPVKAASAKPTSVKAPAKTKPAPSRTTASRPAAPARQALPQSKDKIMATNPIDFTAAFKTAFADFQEKAKTAYEKSNSAFGEANDFAKGNVEAVVESGKILASGLQELGASLVSESRSAFDSLSAEVKELASVKSPTEFVQLQSNLLRKHFDSVVAQTSKNTEAVLKLANEAMSPLSNRVTLAVEKAKKLG